MLLNVYKGIDAMAAWNSKTDLKVTVVLTVIASMGIVYCSMPSDEDTREDIRAEPASISTPDAFDKCRPMIEAKLARPETIDFNLSDTTLSEYGSDVNFSITGTSENAFGTAMRFTASCHFEDGALTNVDVSEG